METVAIKRSKIEIIATATCIMAAGIGYVRGITQSPFLQPVLFFSGILLLICMRKKQISQLVILPIAMITFCFVLLIAQVFLFSKQLNFLNEAGRLLYPFWFSALGLAIFSGISKEKKAYLFVSVIRTLIFFLYLDLAFRLSINGALFPILENRYAFKSGGLLFTDSNFNGTIAGFLLLYLVCGYQNPLFRAEKILCAILVIYSMSYAVFAGVLIAGALCLLGRKFSDRLVFNLTIYLSIFLAPPALAFGLGRYLAGLDGSLWTKYLIFRQAEQILLQGDLAVLLFGLGSGQLKEDFRYASHNFIGLNAELGILFGLIYAGFFVLLFKKIDMRAAPVFIYLVLVGVVSLLPLAYFGVVYLLLLLGFPVIERSIRDSNPLITGARHS